MPPPERVEPDRRRELEEREADREVEEVLADRSGPTPPPPEARVRASPVPLVFSDRRAAGTALAAALRDLGPDVLVLGIPRGGVEVAAVVAEELGSPLDVVIPRKIGAPGNPELGLGAVAEGVEVLDEEMVASLGVGREYLRAEVEAEQEETRRRAAAYRQGRPPPRIAGRVVVVVDDGIATGGTAAAALRWARRGGAARVVLAVPVAPAESLARLRREADEIVVLSVPPEFFAVGQWYEDFEQVGDERVIELLSRSAS